MFTKLEGTLDINNTIVHKGDSVKWWDKNNPKHYFTGKIRHIFMYKTDKPVVFVSMDGNILGNMFTISPEQIEKIEDKKDE